MSLMDFGRARTSEAVPGAEGQAAAMSAAARLVAQSLRRPSLSPAEPALVAAGLDFAAATLAFALVEFRFQGASASLPGAIGCGLLTVAGARLVDGYRLATLRRLALSLVIFLAAAALAWGCGRLAGWITAPILPLLPTLVLLGLPARGLARLLSGWAQDFGLTERRAVVVGGGAEAERLILGLAANPDNDIRVRGIFDDRTDDRAAPVIAGVPRLGTTRELLAFARAAEIDMLIVALPLEATARIQQILRPLSVLPLDVRLSTYSADMEFRRAGAPLTQLGSRPLDARGAILKRAVDLVGASLALLILAIPMALVALAIRFDSPGPALFRQPRHGFNHRPVSIWKFRSMYTDDCDPAARRVVTRDDPRVTPIGRFIRKYSIDELPQLFNVLRGDLSLVGPRPHAVVALTSQQVAFAEIVDGYAARHRMRPGITGWAQVEGWRGEVDDPEKLRRRFEHDLYYIENWSLWFDLRVLALTPSRLLNTRSAY